MKIIVIDNNYTEQGEAPHFSVIADTALLLKNKPFFIPEFASPCTARPHLVVQISRLGRSISEKFAHRYYNKCSAGVIFTAENLWEEAVSEHRSPDYARSFDGAAACGSFVDIDSLNTQFIPFSIRSNEKRWEGDSEKMRFSIDRLVSYISQYQLLRQGDLIFTGCPFSPFEVALNERLEGFIGEKNVLAFNIK